MMVTVKYIIVILRADNDGEGGTFSTYSLLSRYVSSHHDAGIHQFCRCRFNHVVRR